ncbi:terminase small subunit [Hoeflea alexandrii]|uniref:terminase small subunit n=1 Tax=Hoeflea alexandrii TaxID=288436 RepID=UPI0035D03485
MKGSVWSHNAKGRLEKREAFAIEYAKTGNATAAAEVAGVPSGSAHSMGYRWRRDPRVQELVHEAVREQVAHLGPLAVGAIKQILEDPSAPQSVRLSAAKDVLDRLERSSTARNDSVYMKGVQIDQLSRIELEQLVRDEFGRDLSIDELKHYLTTENTKR